MADLDVDGLLFSFQDGWHAAKYDEWSYYRNQFSCSGGSVKAVDVLAMAPDGKVWLIEAKNYLHHGAVPPPLEDLVAVVWAKVRDTLAALLPASLHANDAEEKALATKACRASGLRVVLHLEQPAKRSPLFPRGGIDLANLHLKLRQALRAVDPHPVVASRSRMDGLPWSVR